MCEIVYILMIFIIDWLMALHSQSVYLTAEFQDGSSSTGQTYRKWLLQDSHHCHGDVTVTKKQHRKCQVTCCWHAKFSNKQRDDHFYYLAHALSP